MVVFRLVVNFCLFRVFCLTQASLIHLRHHHCWWRAANFLPMLLTYSHWAVRVLWHATSTVTRGIRLQWSSPRTSDTHTFCRAFSSRAVTTCSYDLGLSRLGFDHRITTFPLRDQRFNPLIHSRSYKKILSQISWTHDHFMLCTFLKFMLNARLQVWVSQVLGDKHYKRMFRVSVGVAP